MRFSKIYAVIGMLLMLIAADFCQANEQLNAIAAQHYADENWSEAVKAYEQITASVANNEQAWFRLANAYLRLKQGRAALDANAHLSEAQQIPASFVLYQKAQALHYLQQEPAMLDALQAAAEQGYSNVNNLKTQAMWQTYLESERFKKIIQLADKNFRPCMHDDKYREFDFWLGEWEVYTNIDKTGPMAGKNTITQVEQGCLIMENWQGAGGSSGISMNYYDGTKQQWVQNWVSGGGTVIDYAGGLIEIDGKNVMRLEGKIFYAAKQQQPQIRTFRGTWTPLDDGVVQQFFEESIDGGKTWYAWFNGYYFPIKGASENAQ